MASGELPASTEVGVPLYEAMSKLATVKQADLVALVRERNQVSDLCLYTTLVY